MEDDVQEGFVEGPSRRVTAPTIEAWHASKSLGLREGDAIRSVMS